MGIPEKNPALWLYPSMSFRKKIGVLDNLEAWGGMRSHAKTHQIQSQYSGYNSGCCHSEHALLQPSTVLRCSPFLSSQHKHQWLANQCAAGNRRALDARKYHFSEFRVGGHLGFNGGHTDLRLLRKESLSVCAFRIIHLMYCIHVSLYNFLHS